MLSSVKHYYDTLLICSIQYGKTQEDSFIHSQIWGYEPANRNAMKGIFFLNFHTETVWEYYLCSQLSLHLYPSRRLAMWLFLLQAILEILLLLEIFVEVFHGQRYILPTKGLTLFAQVYIKFGQAFFQF